MAENSGASSEWLVGRDLEAASSQIDPERKDSLLLSLSKKVELLDHKLNEAEAENAQKLMLGMSVHVYVWRSVAVLPCSIASAEE